MTWENFLFVVAGVSLMGLLEWVHSRLDDWWTEERKEQAVLCAGAALVVVCGIALVIVALKMK